MAPRFLKVTEAFSKHEPRMVLGEAILYRPSDNTIHYLDIEASPHSILYIVHLSPSGDFVSRKEVTITGSRYITALAFRRNKPGYICSTHQGLGYLSEDGNLEEFKFILPKDESMRFNDGACDANGRFWFHSLNKKGEQVGKLYVYEEGKEVRQVQAFDFAIGNGPTWNADSSKMYLNHTDGAIGYVFDYNLEEGTLSNQQVFFDNNKRSASGILGSITGAGNPDGHTTDTNGNVYQAQFGSALLERFTPEGVSDLTIQLPARCVTCPVFGGPALDQLYVTTASEALLPGEMLAGDLGGQVFRVDLSAERVKGSVKHEFAG